MVESSQRGPGDVGGGSVVLRGGEESDRESVKPRKARVVYLSILISLYSEASNVERMVRREWGVAGGQTSVEGRAASLRQKTRVDGAGDSW